MQIKEIGIEEIISYENNPRKNDRAVPQVAESIRQFGFKVPIILDKNFVIVAGHTRFKAAMQLKMDKIPCIIADDLNDEQIRAFRLIDNKCAEFSNWDFDKLREELKTISDEIDMLDFGFDLTEEMLDISDFFAPAATNSEKSERVDTVVCPACGTEFTP